MATRPFPTLNARWLTDERARTVRNVLLAVLPLAVLLSVATSTGGVDAAGKVLGTDYAGFWTAARFALGGDPALTYDVAAHHAAQRAAFGAEVGYTAFFYPPPFLLALLPFGALGYLPSLAAWLGATGYAYWRSVRAWRPGWRGLLPTFLAYPALLINAGHGQNGFLTAALLGGGALALATRPVLGGALLGLLVVKPHLAALVPVALALRGEWRAFAAAGASAGLLALASALLLGPDAWAGFAAAAPMARETLHAGLVEYHKMQSPFAAVRLAGGGVPLAYVAQGLLAAGVVVGLALLARARADARAQGAALVAGALLATPFLLDYDLAIAAAPMLWLWSEGDRTGAARFERPVLAAAFLLPLVARTVGELTSIGPAPFVLAALFALVLRRGLADARA